MREAKANDYWRGVYKKKYDVSVLRVAFRGIAGIADGEVVFSGGISAICGGNGAGKTTLLEAILKGIDASAGRVLGSARGRFGVSEIDVFANKEGGDLERTINFNEVVPGEPLLEITFLDPAAETTRLMQRLHSTSNFDEILEALSPRELTAEELEHVSYLVGKTYTKCSVYEIEEFADEPTFPYFQVTEGEVTYGSEDMGLGEMALHLINWTLERTGPNSVLLIEEPETHLSPRSQDALMNTLARASLRRGIWIIVTTHAPAIVRRIPLEHISLIIRTGGGTRILRNPTRLQLNTVLGIPSRFEGVVLVEDRAAREFMRAVLDRIAPDLGRLYQLIDVGDNSKVIAALEHFPQSAKWMSVVGLLDGDQRGKKFAETQWPHDFLPGDAGPEQLLRMSADPERLSALLHRDSDEVALALAELGGRDDHDWLEELPENIGHSYEAVVGALTTCWLESDGARELADQLAKFIRESAG
jgi:predicted ATPase